MTLEAKAGFRADEDRDEHGRWSATGTPGSVLLMPSRRIMGANNTGDPLSIHVNPRPPGMSRIIEQATTPGYLRSITLDGGSIAVADAMKTTHQEIYDNLASQAHPLLQTREQHHFATSGRNNLFVSAGPNEPHWFRDRLIGVYNYDNRLTPAQWPPGMRRALIIPGQTKSTAIEEPDLKFNFNPSELRDSAGRWASTLSDPTSWPSIGVSAATLATTPIAYALSNSTAVHVLLVGRTLVAAPVLGYIVYQKLKARHPNNELTIRSGSDEPIPFAGKKVGVYHRGKRLPPDAIPGPVKEALRMRRGPKVAAPLGTKRGFDPDEPRDAEGQWTSSGGGGGSSGEEKLAWPHRVHTTTEAGDAHTVHVNPRPSEADKLGKYTDHVNALVLGHNIAAGTASHDDILHGLIKAGHHLVSTYQQRAEAKAPHNRLVFKRNNPSVVDKMLGAEKPFPEWQAKYSGYFNQGLVDESHWPRAAKVAFGVNAGLMIPGIFRTRNPPLRLHLAPRLRLPSPVIRLSAPMNPDLKFNFQPSQPRDSVGRWTAGGGGFDPAYQTFSRIGRRLGNRFGKMPLSPGFLPHPKGEIWVNPSSARIVKLSRSQGGVGEIIRSGKNLIVARGVPMAEAVQHLNENLQHIQQVPEPHVPHAVPQTVMKESPSWLSRKRVVYINPSARNLNTLIRTSKDHKIKTLIIGDNFVAGKGGIRHYDLQRVLQHAGHPLGGQHYYGAHNNVPPRPYTNSAGGPAEIKAGFNASQARDADGRWSGGGGSGRNGPVIGGRMRGMHTLDSGTISHERGDILVNPHPSTLADALADHRARTGKPPTVMASGDNLIVGLGKVTRADLHKMDLRHAPVDVADEEDEFGSGLGIFHSDPSEEDGPQKLIQHPKGSIIVNPHSTDIARMVHGTGGAIHLIHADGNIIAAGSNIPRNEVLKAVAAQGGHFRHIAASATKSADAPAEVKESDIMTELQAALSGFELKNAPIQIPDIFQTAAELKFVGDPEEGIVEGYASIYGNRDQHDDVVMPGAFDESLKEWKERGKPILMYGEHSPYKTGGDPYPIGVWDSLESDGTGLRVKGRLLALDHPDVKRVHTLIKAKALPGISIAYNVNPGGADFPRKSGEPKRLLKSVKLVSIDLTANPSNPLALIDGFKAISGMQQMMAQAAPEQDAEAEGDPEPDVETALDALHEAMSALQDMLESEEPPDIEALADLMMQLHGVRDALTNNHPVPVDMDITDAGPMPDDTGTKAGFNASQARDAEGRWTGGGGGGGYVSRHQSVTAVATNTHIADAHGNEHIYAPQVIRHAKGSVLINPPPAVLASELRRNREHGGSPPLMVASSGNLMLKLGNASMRELRDSNDRENIDLSKVPNREHAVIQTDDGPIHVNPTHKDLATMMYITNGKINLTDAGGNLLAAPAAIPHDEMIRRVAAHDKRFSHLAQHFMKDAVIEVEAKSDAAIIREWIDELTDAEMKAGEEPLLEWVNPAGGFQPTIRQFEHWLRDGAGIGKRKLSHSEAREVSSVVFGKSAPRDEADQDQSAARDLARTLAGFSLSFKGN
jgi:HK97 family phage prohead protease